MCGIYAILNPKVEIETALAAFNRGRHRGPDHTSFQVVDSSLWIGFHRLAINGLHESANQPFCKDGVYLVCNGEIYNHAELVAAHGFPVQSKSDCEVILHLYMKYGMAQTMQFIDASEFAFVLHDTTTNTTYAGRDTHGVRPLYKAMDGATTVLASELKMCHALSATHTVVLPGTVECYDGETWTTERYSMFPRVSTLAHSPSMVHSVYAVLYAAVMKRVQNTDRPIACLLSGGLDSSIVTALVVQCRRDLGLFDPIETYCIGMEGGEDLHHAAVVADHLGTKHTNIVCGPNDFFDAIPTVVRQIESYDTTTVRASVGQYLVAKYISENSAAKVIFNGDGSDELTGGYLYFKCAPNPYEFDLECRRLLQDIHGFDALRSDKCISAHGLEARTPFLDPTVVQTYLSLPREVRMDPRMEKYLLRTAFEHLLPHSVAWRTKEAFSDGVSPKGDSWFQMIQRMLSKEVVSKFNTDRQVRLNPPTTAEQYYYRAIFDEAYPGAANVVPYFWMPKFVKAVDCSARTLAIYAQ